MSGAVPDGGVLQLRLLVVDDEPTVCRMLDTFLKKRNALVVTTSSVAHARQAVGSGVPFDAMIVDKNLPDGSGLDLLREFSAAGLGVILMTGYPTPEAEAAVKAHGGIAYLLKPFDLAALDRSLAQAVEFTRNHRFVRQQRSVLSTVSEGILRHGRTGKG